MPVPPPSQLTLYDLGSYVMHVRCRGREPGPAGRAIHGPLQELTHGARGWSQWVHRIREEDVRYVGSAICITPMPAYVCSCSNVRFILEFDGGITSWCTRDGRIYRQRGEIVSEVATIYTGPPGAPHPAHVNAAVLDRVRYALMIYHGVAHRLSPTQREQYEDTLERIANVFGLPELRGVDIDGAFAIRYGYDDDLAGAEDARLEQILGQPRGLNGEGFGGSVVEADTVKTLTDMARAGNEEQFRELAVCAGVPEHALNDFWTRTLARVTREKKTTA